MVREKTPKIVFYSSLAKCELMESLVDFEMHFYNGWKLKKAGKSDEKLFSDSGAEIGLNYANYFHKNLLKHGQECHQHCVEIERTLSGVSSSNEFTVFPVIVGRRPISNEKENVRNNTFNNYISASQTTFKSPNFQISSFID
jgi:polo-like kinase 4